MTALSNGLALSGASSNGQYPALPAAPGEPVVTPAIVPVIPHVPERLYALLPGIYRLRDAAQGEQLRALLAIIESELRLIEDDMEALYENWFIETCEDWIVPYIGDLLAVGDLNAANPRQFGQERRAYVANTLFYRQRKGTTPVLEQLARDITGWGARAVESLQLVAATQNINHGRSQSQTLRLRPPRATESTATDLEQLGTPFETGVVYTTQIRPGRGDRTRYNPASVALYLWSLQPYLIENAVPRAVKALDEEPQGFCFTFNPLGYDSLPLLNLPQTETELTTLAQEENVPGILNAELLRKLVSVMDGDRLPVQVYVKGKLQPFNVADLREWKSDVPLAIDPERGRLKFTADAPPETVTVTYGEGFSGDIGAGCYERFDAITEQPPVPGQLTWQVQSSTQLAAVVKTWNQYARKWQRCFDRVNLPVARLTNTDDKVEAIAPSSLEPGILQGLQPIIRLGEIDVVITPGVAIDLQGQAIQLPVRHSVLVGCHANETVLLAIAYQSWQPYWRIRVIPQRNGEYHRNANEIPLVEVTVNGDGRVTQSRTALRQAFKPGFVGGFKISQLTRENTRVLSLAPEANAFAVNRNGRKIRLDRVAAFTLPVNVPQTMVLFIAPGKSSEDGRLDIVPDTQRGIIELQGNRTIARNLALQIPAGKRLYLAASNGDRPHLLGTITLHGMATPDTENGGDFYLEGVLLEGPLTVTPGNLQRLAIAHSTLVPNAGGIVVEKAEYEVVDEHTDDVTLLALLMYSLTLLRRLLRTGLADNGLTTMERIVQMTQITHQQMATLIEGLRYIWQRAQCPPDKPSTLPFVWSTGKRGRTASDLSSLYSTQMGNAIDDEEDNPEWCCQPDETINLDEDNAFLSLQIDRSICGAIALADTIPTVSIGESILSGNLEATGSDVAIQKSTLFGSVQAFTLEAEASIFRDRITITRRQVGCLRFCYVPIGSQTPHRYRCQPDLLLSQELDTLPAAITTLTVHPVTQQVFAGTTRGTLRLFPDQWIPFQGGPDPVHITALLAIARPATGRISGDTLSLQLTGTQTRFTQELQPGTVILVQNQSLTVREILSDEELTLESPPTAALPAGTRFEIDTLLAGTADGKLLQTTPLLKSGTGTLTVAGPEVKGQRTRFLQDVEVGDTVLLVDAEGTVVATRIVTAIASDTLLSVDTAFNTPFTDQAFFLRRLLWTPLPAQPIPQLNTRINALLKVQISGTGSITSSAQQVTTEIFAATSGNGLLRSMDSGRSWDEINQGLTNLDVRAIAYHNGTLFAGTFGNGVFRSRDRGLTWTGGDPIDPDVRQTGLTVPDITSIAVNPLNQDIFVGTPKGIFRSSDGGDRWIPINQQGAITTLIGVVQAGTGTISSRYATITGSGTQFQSELQPGDALTINGQTRIVTDLSADPPIQRLTLNDAFDPDLPEGTTFQRFTLFAGTSDGTVYRSTSNGRTWQPITTFANTGVSAFALQDPSVSPVLLAGTSLGSIYRKELTAIQADTQWRSVNRGIPGIEVTLLLMNQMQPRFTSERFGEPTYAQLSTICPNEICTGTEDGSEMGVFNFLKQPQRRANLHASLQEYLRFGLQADILYGSYRVNTASND